MQPCDDGPVGIIAGGHSLPLEVAYSLVQSGREFHIFGLVGEAEKGIEVFPHSWIKWGEIGRLFRELEEKKIKSLLCIGSITRRPDFNSIKLDFGAVKVLPELLRILALGGDEGVLGGVLAFFQKRNLSILSVRDVTPDLVVGDQFSIHANLAEPHENDIQLAAEAANLIGQVDAGQGVVVARGRVLAMEGSEGTDQMLERVKMIREQGRAQWHLGKEGLLLKRARPGQDLRFDMPTVGPRTLELIQEAGLAGLVCSSGEVLCAQRAQVYEFAVKSSLFVVGRSMDGRPS